MKPVLSSRMNPKVDGYLKREKKWQAETVALRTILLECPLAEELKWGKPCYTFEKKNVVVIQGFKEYFALLFLKGALLKDPRGILVSPGENSQSSRQMRFKNVQEIERMKSVLKSYLDEAVALEKAGAKVPLKQTKDFALPAELITKFEAMPALKAAFEALTPGRQRGYIFYLSGAKQSKTRESRVEKCVPQILAGKGLND